MKKRLCKTILSAVIGIAILCGCSDQAQKKPVPLDRESSDTATASDLDMRDEASYQASDSSQTIQLEISSSSSSGGSPVLTDSTAESEPDQQIANGSVPQSSSSSVPQSSSSSVPQSSSSSVPQSSSSSAPQSSSSSAPQSSSNSKPQSTSSSKPQSSSSSKPQSSSESFQHPNPIPSANGSILSDYTSKWAYNHISEKQKQVYGRLYEAANRVLEDCDVSDLGITEDDIYNAYWAFDYDNPQFLELGSGYSYSYTLLNGSKKMKNISIDYSRAASEVQHSEFESAARAVLTAAQARSSDYEKLKYVHDWIVNNTVYHKADADYESEADGPVIYGKAICEGYSKAFMYFAQSMGFECVCAIGSAGGVDHMWNMVKLNGQWYHVDVTWDDPVRSDGKQTLRDDYFLISDSAILRDHMLNSPFTLPTAPNSYT